MGVALTSEWTDLVQSEVQRAPKLGFVIKSDSVRPNDDL